MAAEPQPDWLSCLPCTWSYGVARDGRIFFINEEAQSTTWLHPVSGEAVVTGHRKTPDLPTGWEEGYTFEGARCFINHNERKVTCKHPVTGAPSQENCIFVVNEQPAPKPSSESESEKKERPTSTMSEVSNYTGGSDFSTFPGSPATTTNTATASTRPSRSSKKLHNFGKRSNSIRRNLNAPVEKRGWLYKQDSTGMKLWKKRWFVLSDMCLFYYRDDKEDSILGSILLPSFHISMLSVDDHISKKYAFKATHPNMRTYYFCSDTAKEMESWMKVMTDAALVHTEPLRRMDKVNADLKRSEELNNVQNHQALTRPEIQNNERNREPVRQPSLSRADVKQKEAEKHRDHYTLQRDGERYLVKKDGVSYMLQKDGEKYILHKDGEQFLLRKNGEKYSLQKDEQCSVHRDGHKYGTLKAEEKLTGTPTEDQYAPVKDGHKLLLMKEAETFGVHTRPTHLKDGQKYVPVKEVRRQLSLRETDRSCMFGHNKYGTIHVVDKYGTVKEVKKYSTLREGGRYATLRDMDNYATFRDVDKYGFHRDRSAERAKISIKLQPVQAAAITAAVSASQQSQFKVVPLNGSVSEAGDQTDGSSSRLHFQTAAPTADTASEADHSLSRSKSTQPMEHSGRSHRGRGDDDTISVTSYQTLPRNMPSHRTQMLPRYPEGYRTLPRNSICRTESICSMAGSALDRSLHPGSSYTMSAAEKRRSIKDDTMWQLYEWQQRQAFSRQSLAPPTGAGHYGTLPSTKTMGNISENLLAHSIPTSPSHGSLAFYSTLPPPRQQTAQNPSSPHSELSSPVFRGDMTLSRQQKTHPLKYGYPPERYSIAAGISPHNITPQSLQGKTSEELTLLLIKLRRQQAELNSLREHTLAQLMALGAEGPNAKTDVLSHHLQRSLVYLDSQVSPDTYKDRIGDTEDADIDTKLSRLCEQDKVVRAQEEKLQQLHREKHTLETALLSASQELSEQSSSNSAATQSLIQQRDVLQNGLLSTCRELSRVTVELQQSKQDYNKLEGDVTQAKSNLLEQLEALGSPQTEPPSQRHIQIQKELWRIQDVMEALAKHKPQSGTEAGVAAFPGSKPLSSISKNEQAPDYRLYKSEPELTTVKEEEVDEPNTEDKSKSATAANSHDSPGVSKVTSCPVGVVPPRTKCSMRPPESTTIASYVTLRKTKKPENREERPRSAMDQIGFGERELGRIRMSVEEQLERMRRNQEASTLREKRNKLSRSSSFNKDHASVTLQSWPQTEGACPDLKELDAALQHLKDVTQAVTKEGVRTDRAARLEQNLTIGEVKADKVKDAPEDNDMAQQNSEEHSNNSQEPEECERQTAVILDLSTEPQQVEIVDFQPFEDDEPRDVSSSATNTPTDSSFQTTETEISSPEPKEERPDATSARENRQEMKPDSYSQLKSDDIKHNKNNILAAQTFALVSRDT